MRPCSIENRSVHWEDMRAFWNVGRSCLASRTAHAPAPTPPNRPTAKTFARPSAHGALKAARTLAGSRRLPHAHGRTGCRHVHPTSQHEAPGLMLCLENRPPPSDSFSTVLVIKAAPSRRPSDRPTPPLHHSTTPPLPHSISFFASFCASLRPALRHPPITPQTPYNASCAVAQSPSPSASKTSPDADPSRSPHLPDSIAKGSSLPPPRRPQPQP